MIDIGMMIRQLREERNITQEKLGSLIGVTKQTISNYEKNARRPDYEMLESLADVFNVSISFFLTKEEQERELERIRLEKLPPNIRRVSDIKPHRVPLIGSVAAGVPILAEQEYDIFVDAPAKADYALTVDGDSMGPIYLDGDVVYIREQPDVDNGQIGVVLIDDSATLKRVYHIPGGLQLISENPKYPPMLMMGEDHDCIRILGIVVGYTRMYNAANKLNGASKGILK